MELTRFFTIEKQEETGFIARRQPVMIYASFIGIAALSLFAISHLLNGKYYTALINGIGLLALFTNLYYFKKKAAYLPSISIVISVCVGVVVAQHIVAPPSLQLNILWTGVWGLGVTVLLPRRHSFPAVLFLLLIALLAEYLHQHGTFTIHEFTEQESFPIDLASLACGIICSFLLGQIITATETKAIKRLNQKNRESIAINEEYSTLLNVLSHDFSNYINIIDMHSYILLNDSEIDSEEDKMSLKRINDASTEMAELINQVKAYRLNENDSFTIQCKAVDPVLAITSSMDYFQEKAAAKKIRFHFTYPHSPPNILADPVSLVNHVLNNVFTNAIKFSYSERHISVKVQEEKEKVQIVITDQGTGISEEDLATIFSKKIVSRKGTMGELGSGFGMNIIQRYMEKYDGEVGINSSAKGTTGTEVTLTFRKA